MDRYWGVVFLALYCQLGGFGVYSFNESVYVEVPDQGLLRGERFYVNNNLNVLYFGRIPYAAPPLGELRFSRPGPPPSWEGERDSTYWGPACPQYLGRLEPSEDFVSEDCLYMNIHSPEKTNGDSNNYPAILFIQGGGFQLGSSMLIYGGNVLAEKEEVVLVNFNYRINALGFLSTEDDVAHGNWGMWDQLAAMQWVQNNIALFHGDPNSVTIYGQSAGAVSVGLQMMSPHAEGLFHKAILQSGSPLSYWSVKLPPHSSRENAEKLAAKMGCPTNPSSALVDCLRTKDAYNISSTAATIEDNGQPPFLPMVDGPDNFLPHDPFMMMKNGNYYKVPIMAGYTSSEWAQVAMEGVTNPVAGINRTEFRQLIKEKVMNRKFESCSPVKYDDITNAMEFFYTPWQAPEDPHLLRDNFIKLESEEYFVSGIHYFLMHTFEDNENPTYLYEFDYESESAPYDDYVDVPHVEDLYFVFGRPYKFNEQPDFPPAPVPPTPPGPPIPNRFIGPRAPGLPPVPLPPGRDLPTGRNFTDEDRVMSDVAMRLWGNFAKYGDPTPLGHSLPGIDERWTNYSVSDKGVFHIDKNSEMRHDFDFKVVSYWYDYDPKVEQSASNRCCDCVTIVTDDPDDENPDGPASEASVHRVKYDGMFMLMFAIYVLSKIRL